jgi:hypothetical protein
MQALSIIDGLLCVFALKLFPINVDSFFVHANDGIIFLYKIQTGRCAQSPKCFEEVFDYKQVYTAPQKMSSLLSFTHSHLTKFIHASENEFSFVIHNQLVIHKFIQLTRLNS